MISDYPFFGLWPAFVSRVLCVPRVLRGIIRCRRTCIRIFNSVLKVVPLGCDLEEGAKAKGVTTGRGVAVAGVYTIFDMGVMKSPYSVFLHVGRKLARFE